MNEIEQKQIEEMAKEIQKSVDGCANYWAKLIATYLYEQGYRNCKDKVVLSKEELNTIQANFFDSGMEYTRKEMQAELRQASELKAETIKLAKQETAREFAEKLKRNFYDTMPKYTSEDTYEYFCKVNYMAQEIDEIAKQYGVGVE
jgi:hypothetical protein